MSRFASFYLFFLLIDKGSSIYLKQYAAILHGLCRAKKIAASLRRPPFGSRVGFKYIELHFRFSSPRKSITACSFPAFLPRLYRLLYLFHYLIPHLWIFLEVVFCIIKSLAELEGLKGKTRSRFFYDVVFHSEI